MQTTLFGSIRPLSDIVRFGLNYRVLDRSGCRAVRGMGVVGVLQLIVDGVERSLGVVGKAESSSLVMW